MRAILIVEDNEADQYLNELIISKMRPDVKVYKALDGQEALDVLNEHQDEIDLILLDINMPRMNGHDFLKNFSPNNEREIPVVVMLTSSGQQEDREKAMAFNCVKDYLMKPFNPDMLDHLEKLCGCK